MKTVKHYKGCKVYEDCRETIKAVENPSVL